MGDWFLDRRLIDGRFIYIGGRGIITRRREGIIMRRRDGGGGFCDGSLPRTGERRGQVRGPQVEIAPNFDRLDQTRFPQAAHEPGKLVLTRLDGRLGIEQQRQFLDGVLVTQPDEFAPVHGGAFCAFAKKPAAEIIQATQRGDTHPAQQAAANDASLIDEEGEFHKQCD